MAESNYKKKQKALKQRVEKSSEDLYADFEIVHDLVSSAFAEYEISGNLAKTLKSLGRQILNAAKTA